MTTRWRRRVGYLVAASAALAVWLFANVAAGVLTGASLLPFQIFPGPGTSWVALTFAAVASAFILKPLAERVDTGGYLALLSGVAAVASLLAYVSLIGVYAALDESPPPGVRLEGKYSQAHSVWFSPDGSELVGPDGFVRPAIRRWDARTGELRHTTKLGSEDYLALDQAVFSPDGQTLAVPDSVKKAVTLWDVAAGSLRLGPLALGDQCCAGGIKIVFSPDSNTLVTVSEGSDHGPVVALWDARTGELKRALPGELAAFSPDGRALAVSDRAHEAIRVWDAQTFELKRTMRVEVLSRPSVLAFSPDGKALVSGPPYSTAGEAPDIGVWDIHTGRFESKLSGRRPTELAFSPDGRLLALNDRHMLEIYDARSWGRVRRFQPCESSRNIVGSGRRGDPIRSTTIVTSPRRLAFSPDGKTLVTACGAGSVKLWNVGEL